MIRRRLQAILFEAWKQSIEQDYQNQRINSERSLQASYWGQLNRMLPAKSWKIFVEPGFPVGPSVSKKNVYPDIVICNAGEIIGVVELKYQPRALPKRDKDLQTLSFLSQHYAKLKLENHRFRGEKAKARTYHFSDKTVFAWAGVHGYEAKQGSLIDTSSFAEGKKELHGHYLELHAETEYNTHPKVFKKQY